MIDTRPDWLVKRSIERGVIVVDGVKHNYTVIERFPDVPLLYQVGFPDTYGDTLFISFDVPEAWRPFYLRYEVRQALSTDAEICKYQRCLALEIVEVFEQLPSQRRDYVQKRVEFFAHLMLYYKDEKHKSHLEARHPDFLMGMQWCLSFLSCAVQRYLV